MPTSWTALGSIKSAAAKKNYEMMKREPATNVNERRNDCEKLLTIALRKAEIKFYCWLHHDKNLLFADGSYAHPIGFGWFAYWLTIENHQSSAAFQRDLLALLWREAKPQSTLCCLFWLEFSIDLWNRSSAKASEAQRAIRWIKLIIQHDTVNCKNRSRWGQPVDGMLGSDERSSSASGGFKCETCDD